MGEVMDRDDVLAEVGDVPRRAVARRPFEYPDPAPLPKRPAPDNPLVTPGGPNWIPRLPKLPPVPGNPHR